MIVTVEEFREVIAAEYGWSGYGRMKRARRAGVFFCGFEDDAAWHKIVTADPCPYCDKRTSGTVDHVQPLGERGDHSPENIVGACRKCNTRKSDHSLLHYLAIKRDFPGKHHLTDRKPVV